ncbi:MAG: hypothetical protein IPJ06_04450 [Saprospiraceae bacterium]|nr:hypothetical protein [Saprospiraceae bacterium]
MRSSYLNPSELGFDVNGWLSTNYVLLKIKNNSKEYLCCKVSNNGYLTTTITTIDVLPPLDSVVFSPDVSTGYEINMFEGDFNYWLDPGDEHIFLVPIRLIITDEPLRGYLLIFPYCIFAPDRALGIGGWDRLKNFYISIPTQEIFPNI